MNDQPNDLDQAFAAIGENNEAEFPTAVAEKEPMRSETPPDVPTANIQRLVVTAPGLSEGIAAVRADVARLEATMSRGLRLNELLQHRTEELMQARDSAHRLQLDVARLTYENQRLAADRAGLDERLTRTLSQLSTRDRANLSSDHDAIHRRFMQLKDQDFTDLTQRVYAGSRVAKAGVERARWVSNVRAVLANQLLAAGQHTVAGAGILPGAIDLERFFQPWFELTRSALEKKCGSPEVVAQFHADIANLVRLSLEWCRDFALACDQTPARLLFTAPGLRVRFDPAQHEAEFRCPEDEGAVVLWTSFPGYMISPPARVLSKAVVFTMLPVTEDEQ